MKKIFLSLFVLSFLFIGSNVYAQDTVPHITVLSPKGGESVEIGKMLEIKWSSPTLVGLMFDVYVSDGTYKGEVLKVLNTGSTMYPINGNLIPGSGYKAYVYLSESVMIGGSSEGTFTIKEPSAPGEVPEVVTSSGNSSSSSSSSSVTSGNIEGCSAGYKFSIKTGQLCPEIQTNNNCLPGYKFNPMTGIPCTEIKNSCTTSGSNCGVKYVISRSLKLLVPRMTGEDVKMLQTYLGITADGVFGRGTKAKVMEWQAENGLTPDGAFGAKSRAKAGLGN